MLILDDCVSSNVDLIFEFIFNLYFWSEFDYYLTIILNSPLDNFAEFTFKLSININDNNINYFDIIFLIYLTIDLYLYKYYNQKSLYYFHNLN